MLYTVLFILGFLVSSNVNHCAAPVSSATTSPPLMCLPSEIIWKIIEEQDFPEKYNTIMSLVQTNKQLKTFIFTQRNKVNTIKLSTFLQTKDIRLDIKDPSMLDTHFGKIMKSGNTKMFEYFLNPEISGIQKDFEKSNVYNSYIRNVIQSQNRNIFDYIIRKKLSFNLNIFLGSALHSHEDYYLQTLLSLTDWKNSPNTPRDIFTEVIRFIEYNYRQHKENASTPGYTQKINFYKKRLQQILEHIDIKKTKIKIFGRNLLNFAQSIDAHPAVDIIEKHLK